jgi:hypothetical protein
MQVCDIVRDLLKERGFLFYDGEAREAWEVQELLIEGETSFVLAHGGEHDINIVCQEDRARVAVGKWTEICHIFDLHDPESLDRFVNRLRMCQREGGCLSCENRMLRED